MNIGELEEFIVSVIKDNQISQRHMISGVAALIGRAFLACWLLQIKVSRR